MEKFSRCFSRIKNPAPDEFAPHDLQSLSFKSHLEKEEFENMVSQQNNWFGKAICFNVSSVNVFHQIFLATLLIITVIYGLPIHFRQNYLIFVDFGDYQYRRGPAWFVKDNRINQSNCWTNEMRRRRPTIMKHLLTDTKEVGEHRMLVDWGEADIGWMNKLELSKLLSIWKLNISIWMYFNKYCQRTQLENLTVLDALKATLPALNCLRALKIRAMQMHLWIVVYRQERQEQQDYRWRYVSGRLLFAPW